MGDTLKLALQLTAVDMMSGVLIRMKQNVLSLGAAGKQVARDFDQMEAHITKGLKGIAVAHYGMQKIVKGITPAADLQEAIIDVKMNLMESGKDAKVLGDELAKVRATAVGLQKIAPFSAQDVVEIENVFLKAGLKLKDVTTEGGAAWAATALATITKVAPATIAESMVSMATPFSLKGEQYKEMADYLQKVDMASVTNVPELMEGARYVAGTAAKLGITWQQMLQAQGTLAQNNMRGSMGGTALNDMLGGLVGGHRMAEKMLGSLNRSLKKQGRDPLEFWDKQGKLKEFPTIIKNLRESLKGFKDKDVLHFVEKFFGKEGARAVWALVKEGEGSYDDIGESIKRAVSLQEKMDERLKGFNANVTSLSGTTKTTMATLFDPMLDGLTAVLKQTNDVVDATGKFAADHPDLTKGANYAAAGAVGLAGTYGAYHLLKGGLAAGRVWKGLKGVGSTGLGIAEGKAIQAATGVQSVFVVNMPSGGITDTLATTAVAAAAGGAATKGLLARMGAGASLALPWVAGTAAAGAGGYMLGTGLNQGMGKLSGMMSDGKYGGEGWLGDLLFALLHDKKEPTKNEINMSIAIDQHGRTVTQSDDPNTRTNINTMKRGSFADANNF